MGSRSFYFRVDNRSFSKASHGDDPPATEEILRGLAKKNQRLWTLERKVQSSPETLERDGGEAGLDVAALADDLILSRSGSFPQARSILERMSIARDTIRPRRFFRHDTTGRLHGTGKESNEIERDPSPHETRPERPLTKKQTLLREHATKLANFLPADAKHTIAAERGTIILRPAIDDARLVRYLAGEGIYSEIATTIREQELKDEDVLRKIREAGIIIRPGYHYSLGGIKVDENLRSVSRPNVYALGEAASLYGPNKRPRNAGLIDSITLSLHLAGALLESIRKQKELESNMPNRLDPIKGPHCG